MIFVAKFPGDLASPALIVQERAKGHTHTTNWAPLLFTELTKTARALAIGNWETDEMRWVLPVFNMAIN